MRPRDVTEGIPACGVSCATASLHICADGVARRGRRLRSSDNRAVLRAPRTPQPRRISNGDRFVADREKKCLQINTRRHAEGPIMASRSKIDYCRVLQLLGYSRKSIRFQGRIVCGRNHTMLITEHAYYCNKSRIILPNKFVKPLKSFSSVILLRHTELIFPKVQQIESDYTRLKGGPVYSRRSITSFHPGCGGIAEAASNAPSGNSASSGDSISVGTIGPRFSIYTAIARGESILYLSIL